MYWFRIFYYENIPGWHCKPMTNADGKLLLVYASTPQEASKAAQLIINEDDTYAHHIPFIGTLGSHVEDCDIDKWHRDMRKVNV